MSIAKSNIFINAPLEIVYTYIKNPSTWTQWHTHLCGPAKIIGDGGVGTVARMMYCILDQNIPTTLEVVEDSPSYRRVKYSGVIKADQTLDFIPIGNGTEVEVVINYSIPASVLEVMPERTIVERLVQNAINHTTENLKTICEGMV